MSLMGDVGRELKEDMAEVGVLLGLFVVGLILMMFGFFWAGAAAMFYAFYRFLPDEDAALEHAKKEAEERVSKNITKSKIAWTLFMEGKAAAALERLENAGYSADEIADILEEWKKRREKERKKRYKKGAAELFG